MDGHSSSYGLYVHALKEFVKRVHRKDSLNRNYSKRDYLNVTTISAYK